jgi:hypothetical protein
MQTGKNEKDSGISLSRESLSMMIQLRFFGMTERRPSIKRSLKALTG